MDEHTYRHQVVVGVTEKAQREALKVGRSGSAVQLYELPTDMVPRALELPFSEVDEQGRVQVRWGACFYPYTDRAQGSHWEVNAETSERPPLDEVPLNTDFALTAIREAHAKRIARRVEATQAKLKKWLAGEDVPYGEQLAEDPDLTETQRTLAKAELDQRNAQQKVRLAEAQVEVRAWIASNVMENEPESSTVWFSGLHAEVEAQKEKLRLAVKAQKEAEKLCWIREHGSERLKKLVALGLPFSEVLEEEQEAAQSARLAKERPGWSWDDDEAVTLKELTDSRRITTEALDALEEAKKVAPDAELVWLTNEDTEDAKQRVVLRARFERRTIWREIGPETEPTAKPAAPETDEAVCEILERACDEVDLEGPDGSEPLLDWAFALAKDYEDELGTMRLLQEAIEAARKGDLTTCTLTLGKI